MDRVGIKDYNQLLGLTSIEKTNLPTISPFVIDGNTHAPSILMLLVSLPL
jgi:hypothetical protein